MLISIMMHSLLYLQGLANIKFDDFMENKSLAVSLVSWKGQNMPNLAHNFYKSRADSIRVTAMV